MAAIPVGAVGESSQVVTAELTAASYGSGLVPTFSTPAMIALMENASVRALAQYMETGQTSVGVEVAIRHLAATPVGMTVTARAEVIAVEGRRVQLRVTARDEIELIGEGTHGRAVIDEARFQQRFVQKLEAGRAAAGHGGS
jgi:predicted thioesterase